MNALERARRLLAIGLEQLAKAEREDPRGAQRVRVEHLEAIDAQVSARARTYRFDSGPGLDRGRLDSSTKKGD